MTPDIKTALRTMANALPPGHTMPVPREWLLDLLEGVTTADATPPDLTVAEVAARFTRAPSTVRSWILSGHLRAYRFQGREHRVSREALEAFEAKQRLGSDGKARIEHLRARAGPVDLAAYRNVS